MKGRRALVTGAAAGLGKAYAVALAQAGADVAICDVNDSVKAVRDEIRGLGVNCWAKVADVAKKKHVKAFVDGAAAKLGGLDIVVQFPVLVTVPVTVQLCRLDVHVAEAVPLEVEFPGDGRGAEGQVVAVADIDSGPPERLGAGGPADAGPGLDEQRADTVPGQVRGADKTVVPAADDDRVVVMVVRCVHDHIVPLG